MSFSVEFIERTLIKNYGLSYTEIQLIPVNTIMSWIQMDIKEIEEQNFKNMKNGSRN